MSFNVLWKVQFGFKIFKFLNLYMIQEKVACLEDNDARLALDPQNRYRIQVLLYRVQV